MYRMRRKTVQFPAFSNNLTTRRPPSSLPVTSAQGKIPRIHKTRKVCVKSLDQPPRRDPSALPGLVVDSLEPCLPTLVMLQRESSFCLASEVASAGRRSNGAVKGPPHFCLEPPCHPAQTPWVLLGRA
ncbi:hypothetical protein DPEC_G00096810 [Dallia pectoralis]|uniref:Uncharacterized protein n=1 Tax=Dallia pectoralis TaxID=75939 RepID=A0ACC2GVD6_DALPE|nr:hypothetical protein DPEC_G00096810 [Dallia pectoralis]